MININKLTAGNYGGWVKFKGEMYGRIKSWNRKQIFVVYLGILIKDKISWEKGTSEATDPKDLKFVKEPTELFIYRDGKGVGDD